MKNDGMAEISLEGKVAVVTGATGGWGSGTAYALAPPPTDPSARPDSGTSRFLYSHAMRGFELYPYGPAGR